MTRRGPTIRLLWPPASVMMSSSASGFLKQPLPNLVGLWSTSSAQDFLMAVSCPRHQVYMKVLSQGNGSSRAAVGCTWWSCRPPVSCRLQLGRWRSSHLKQISYIHLVAYLVFSLSLPLSVCSLLTALKRWAGKQTLFGWLIWRSLG